jgi:hypothetical protein
MRADKAVLVIYKFVSHKSNLDSPDTESCTKRSTSNRLAVDTQFVQLVPHTGLKPMCVKETDRRMLFRERITVYNGSRKEHINTLCEINVISSCSNLCECS